MCFVCHSTKVSPHSLWNINVIKKAVLQKIAHVVEGIVGPERCEAKGQVPHKQFFPVDKYFLIFVSSAHSQPEPAW